MKFTLITACLIAAVSSTAASNIPEAYPAQRYEALWKHSPFTLSSISDDEPSVAGLAERYCLGGAFTIGDKDYVFVVDKSDAQKRILISKEPNEQGMALESIQYDPLMEKTTAKIKLGDESGVISFDPSVIKSAAPVVANATPVVNVQPVQRPPMTPYNPGNPPNPVRTYRRSRIIAPPPAVTPTRP